MVTTTSLKVGESLTIGLYFNDNYQLPTTCNLIVFIGGVCVGNLFTQEPEIEKVGIYYTIRLSSQDTSKMRGYRDLIVVLDDPEGFGNKKFVVGGILFDRVADEFITTSENQGYNMLIGMTVDESIVSGNVELIEAIKGEKGDQGDKGEDAVLPDGIVIDENYVHTDNNYTNADKILLSTALQSESDPVYALDKNRLSNTSGVNTGDQDLSGLVEKVPLHSLVHDIEINKLAEYPQFPQTPEGYYLADDGTFKALPDFVTDSEMVDYVGSEIAAGSVVINEYVDQQDALKVDKVDGKGLSTEDYTTAEKSKVANVPLNTNAELGLKVDKVEGSSIVPDAEINKLAGYPELTGNPNKFVSDDGTVKEITSSIGVIGTDLYASVEPSTLLSGAYQLKQTIDPTETQMTIIAGGGAIVEGAKFIDENPAQSFPMGTVGFDYWRKISSLAGEARKGLRFFLFDTADNSETDIFAPLWSSTIEVTDFTERQISYSVPAVNPTATQHYGVEFLFTATGSDKTLTYIVGDGRGWFMRLPLPLKHENLTDKNSEAAFQHVDERINEIPAEAGSASYTLLNRRQNLITGTLPNGVNSTLTLPALVAGERNEVILHFKTNAVAAPTLVYSGFTPVWLNGTPISMKVNKQYTIVFEQINGIVKTSWGEY